MLLGHFKLLVTILLNKMRHQVDLNLSPSRSPRLLRFHCRLPRWLPLNLQRDSKGELTLTAF